MISNSTFNGAVLAAFSAVLFPLVSFIIIALFGSRLHTKAVNFLAVAGTFLSLIASAVCFTEVWQKEAVYYSVPWLHSGNIQIKAGIALDNLSVILLLLITFITGLVMIYSTVYMKGERNYARYFSHLSLFLFAMLGLILADSLFLLYIFWELVGFASYLLIGFWFDKESAARAGKKAFLINRIGDVIFFIGIMIMLLNFSTLEFKALFNSVHSIENTSILTIASLCIFCGAVAKSAQFPLHVWLPDAMEGPTAVSSLIHAATMVAAGVYLTARIFPFLTQEALDIILLIGSFTAFMAATMALTQYDIKKVLAYSTISQLGFMTAAIGCGAYSAALFHLITHAFFKCLLFLAAGAIIHELHRIEHKHHLKFDPQDMRLMGGLKKKMPLTYLCFLAGAAALAGLPFFSGYLSKDLILMSLWSKDNIIGQLSAYLVTLTAGLTAFYIFRLIFSVFYGKNRLKQKTGDIPVQFKDAPKPMLVPMLVLSIFTLFIVYSANPLHGTHSWIMEGLISPLNRFIHQTEILVSTEIWVPLATVSMAVGAIALAYFAYAKKRIQFLPESHFLYRFSLNAWYIDDLYQVVFISPFMRLVQGAKTLDKKVIDNFIHLMGHIGLYIARLTDAFDALIIDGLINQTAQSIGTAGRKLMRLQSGHAQQYMALGIGGLLLIIFLSYIF